LRRFRRSGQLPRLSPLVDFCNAVSVAYALPVAALDLDRVDEFLEVRPALGHEKYLSFENKIEHPGPGEMIFADASENVHARRWTFRQSLLSVIGPKTDRALIISEAMHKDAARDVESLLDTLTSGLKQMSSPPVLRMVLTREDPRLDF
jgi:DNA/RNA-binding domain of Phe-tRNA-synthetase-like protein